jgi:choline dehydrogenase-like flavoprotein
VRHRRRCTADSENVSEHFDIVIVGAGAGGGTVNPALTAMANPIRVGEHTLERTA